MAGKKLVPVLLMLTLMLVCPQAHAWSPRMQSAGFALANGADVDLPHSRDLRLMGLMVDCQWRFFDFKKWNIDLRAELQMNGWYNDIVGMETALAAVLRANVPLDGVTPYFELGSGPALEAFNVPEQGTWFNFLNFVGVGLDINLDEDSWLELGLRLRHISNAGLDEKNSGINSLVVHLGYSVDWASLAN